LTGYDDIEFASLSHVGIKRSHNQDSYAVLPAKDLEHWHSRGHIFVVADGMGAHAVGELASKLAADTIPHIYSKYAHEGAHVALRKAFVEANFTIHSRGQQNREFEGMGTTGTALLVRPEGVWIAHVGDSRAYRVRDGRIEQLSFDHSLVWELARRQRKTPEQMHGIPPNVIVRSLGPEPNVQVDIEGPHPIKPGDHFVLCSDGLSGPVGDRDIGAIVGSLPPEEAAGFLIDLANLQGGPDNITAIVVRVDHATVADASHGKRPPNALITALSQFVMRSWPLLSIFTGIVLSLAAIYLLANHLHGGLLSFVLAGIALIAGLAGLIIQNMLERKTPEEPAEPPWKPRTNIYRHMPCAIDEAYVDKISETVTRLEGQIRARNGQADWDVCHRHLAEAKRLRGTGEVLEAFRESCRALQVLMHSHMSQHAKAEMFRPLWDRVPNN